MVITNLHEQARKAREIAETNPAKSAIMAQAVVRQAGRAGSAEPHAMAECALGLAALHLADPDTALHHLRTAVRLAQRAGCAELVADSRRTLAFALVMRGRGRQALREIEAALQDLDPGVAYARAQAQRATIQQLLGNLVQALPDYQAALPVLRDAGDLEWVNRVVNNRAVLYGYQQKFAAAEADLREAEQICARLGLDLALGYVQENLGWINALRGEVLPALHYLDLAERRMTEHGVPVGELLTDRSQLLLSVRLLGEAVEAAERAVHAFSRGRGHAGLPEARLLLAQAAILDGQAAQGLEQARMAVREFTRQRQPRWAVLARFTVLRARTADGQQSGAAPGVALWQLEHIATDLAAAGWLSSSLEARLIAGKFALQRGRTGRACAQFQEASRHRQRGPALQRAQAWYAEALLRRANGQRRGAVTAARTALRIMDEHRDSLGATDLRAHASGHRVDVAEFGLRMAFEDGRPSRVLEWAEVGRASHLLLRPVRPPDDPDLAVALSELRATTRELMKTRGEGGGEGSLRRRQVTLEREIRDRYRHVPPQPGAPQGQSLTSPALSDALGDAALIEFVHLDGILHAVTVADGRIRLHRLGAVAEAAELITWTRFALHRLGRQRLRAASLAAARDVLASTARRLDAILMRPLAASTAGRPLVLVPTGPLQSLPWSILPSCAGRPVTVTPSAALWCADPADDHCGEHAMAAAGPGLPGADAEAITIAGLHKADALTGAEATVQAVMARIDGAKVAHLAAHGHTHPSNPLFTSLTFADGPLTVYDLKQLTRAPALVVLAACDMGRPTVRSGDELLGHGATLLALGTRQIIAPVVSVPDTETAPLMVALHHFLIQGEGAASALARAQQELSDAHPADTAAAAGFVSIGTSSCP